MKIISNTTQAPGRLFHTPYLGILFWSAIWVLLVLASTSSPAWAETEVPPGGTVPPGLSPCKGGALVARPDIIGTTTSSAVELMPLENDKIVPPGFSPTTQAITLTSVTSPTHGSVEWAKVDVTTTVTYTPDVDFTGADVFSYTAEDECGRSASGRIVVVVFRDDMPTLPDIVTRPVGPGQGARQQLTLPFHAVLSIPAEIFAQTDGTPDPHFFIATDLGKPQEALDRAPGPGKRFAGVAFSLVEYRKDSEVVGPVYQVPLILEIAFDLAVQEAPELFYWDEANNEWRNDGIERRSYDPGTGIATFAIYHLTDFAAFAGASGQQFIYLPSVTTHEVTGN